MHRLASLVLIPLMKYMMYFQKRKYFFIYDDRAHPDNNYYSALTEGELTQFNNYTKVTASNGTSITYKDVIEAMINDQH